MKSRVKVQERRTSSVYRSRSLQSEPVCLPRLTLPLAHINIAQARSSPLSHILLSPNVMTVRYMMQFVTHFALWLCRIMLFPSQMVKFARSGSGGSASGSGGAAQTAPRRKRLNAAKHRTTNTVKRCLPAGLHTHLQAGLERPLRCSVVEPRGYVLLGELVEASVLHEHRVDAAPGSRGRDVSVFLLDSLDHSCHRGTVTRRTRRINTTAEDRPLHQTPRMHVWRCLAEFRAAKPVNLNH